MPIQKITSGIIQDGAVAAADIVSVSNTAISGNIISSQIAPNQTLNGNLTISGTGFTKISVGTTAQRPTSNAAGYIRHNTSLGYPEWYDETNSTWLALGDTTYNVDYIIVGGGGGGGGAGAVGQNGKNNGPAAGGDGTASSITGSSVTYAGGGGGGSDSPAGAGGAGGGGNAGTAPGGTGVAGTTNRGGGGGGGSGGGPNGGNGGSGGSGIVIISIPTARYSSTTTGTPTVTTSGANTILQFISTGSYTA